MVEIEPKIHTISLFNLIFQSPSEFFCQTKIKIYFCAGSLLITPQDKYAIKNFL